MFEKERQTENILLEVERLRAFLGDTVHRINVQPYADGTDVIDVEVSPDAFDAAVDTLGLCVFVDFRDDQMVMGAYLDPTASILTTMTVAEYNRRKEG